MKKLIITISISVLFLMKHTTATNHVLQCMKTLRFKKNIRLKRHDVKEHSSLVKEEDCISTISISPTFDPLSQSGLEVEQPNPRYKRHGNIGGIIDLHGSAKCADCGEIKSNEHFTFYKNRIHPHTNLCLYANKKCTECRKHYTLHKKTSEEYIRKNNISRPKPTKETPYICDCCNKPIYTSKTLQLDHCHKTGKFRGWTCKPCNISLGNLGDDIPGVMNAIKYLNKTEHKTPNEIQYMIDSIF